MNTLHFMMSWFWLFLLCLLSAGRSYTTLFRRTWFFNSLFNVTLYLFFQLFWLFCKKFLIFLTNLIHNSFFDCIQFLINSTANLFKLFFFFDHSISKACHIFINCNDNPPFKFCINLTDYLLLKLYKLICDFFFKFGVIVIEFIQFFTYLLIFIGLVSDKWLDFRKVAFDSILNEIKRDQILST